MPPRNAGRRRSLVPDGAGKKTPYRMLSADGCPELLFWSITLLVRSGCGTCPKPVSGRDMKRWIARGLLSRCRQAGSCRPSTDSTRPKGLMVIRAVPFNEGHERHLSSATAGFRIHRGYCFSSI